MAITNHERVGKALELLKAGLGPFVEREFKAKYGDGWAFEVKDILSDTRLGAGKTDSLNDVAALLVVMDRKWGDVFRQILGKTERSLVNEILAIRNSWAHQETFSGDDAYRALDSAGRLLTAVAGAWIGAQPPNVQGMLIVDLFGKLRLVLWTGGSADVGRLEQDLVTQCGAWWTGELLNMEELDEVTRQVYESAWQTARLDDDEPRLRILDRHRSRTAWFSRSVEPPWPAPEEGPPIIVFYSFKGGLGRSTLLASFAIQRARLGERVCVLDFDLDSPGVGRLLSADPEGMTARWGVVDFLLERSPTEAPLADYFHRCDRVAGAGEIVAFPSGYMDEGYADKLARVDLEEPPEAHESGLWKLLHRVRDELKPQWILLDARTGISEPAGQLLSGIAHLHVLLGTTHDQSWQGLNRVLDRLGKERGLADSPQAEVLLVQAMVPSGETGKFAKEKFVARAEEEFDKRYYLVADEADPDRFWTLDDKDSQDAPHASMPVDYDSRLASFGDIAEVADALCGGPYPPIVERIMSRFLTEPET